MITKGTIKFLLLLTFLFVPAWTLAQEPALLTVAMNHVTATNTSSKSISLIALKVNFDVPFANGEVRHDVTEVVHDFLFTGALTPQSEAEVLHADKMRDEILPTSKAVSAKLIYVEMVDGTTWGSTDEFVNMRMALRKPVLDFYKHALSAYSTAGVEALKGVLNAENGPARGKADFVNRVLITAGEQAAVENIKTSLANASAHPNLIQ
jgi:hypothetical protein